MRVAAIAVFVAAFAANPAGQSRQINTGFLDRSVVVAGSTYRFSVYVPSDYTPDKAWPILADLHANGAQGDDGIRQTAHFLADQIRLKRSRFPLIVIFPQAARGSTWSSSAMPEMVMAEIEMVSAEFHGDKTRTYLSGFSMGGDGVYDVAARWPERFAALIAISALGPSDNRALVQRIQRIPLKIFHGAEDERVPVQAARRLVADLKKAGAAIEYTEYPDARHGPTAERTYENGALFDWLLAQHQN
jgi:predicted peptidase